MSILLSVNNLTKHVGDKSLFEDLSFGVFEKEKVGLIGPNGAGKSTLLKILARQDQEDAGTVTYRKNLKVAFVAQKDTHPTQDNLLNYARQKIQSLSPELSESEAEVLAATQLSIVGFANNTQSVSKLSGGWLKRLSLAIALATEPELLILDEPTNHMDWAGVLWLESFLKSFKGSFLLVSHDRTLLENTTNRTLEINPSFKNGYLSYNLSYNAFLDKKDEYLKSQLNLQESLSNKARRETEWLNAGVKARTTKSRSRIAEAHSLLDDVEDLNTKNRAAVNKATIEVADTQRKTKKLIELKDLTAGYPGTPLAQELSLILRPKECYGLLGHNGSGKTTLLKTMTKQLDPLEGSVRHADDLKILYIEQKRSDLPMDQSLSQFLGDGGDYVTFKNQSVHVASYASRFLFPSTKLNTPIRKLSGGEQARLLLAKALLQPADILVLDEPTNDLDIATIAVLEETILKFHGLVLLVSHDRSFLNNVCTHFIGLSQSPEVHLYADIDQWLNKKEKSTKPEKEKKKNPTHDKPKVKLSYKDKKFLEQAEDLIMEEESHLETLNQTLQNAVENGLGEEIQKLSIQISEKQEEIDGLYSKWEDLNTIKDQMKD